MAQQDKHSRTEPPTPKRRREARDRGQVARSPDVSGWTALLVGSFLVPMVVSRARADLLGTWSEVANVISNPTIPGALLTLTSALRAAFSTVVLTAAGMLGVGVVTNAAQVGRAFSLKALRPKFSRISPKAGVRRLFSAQTSVQLGKQTLKLVVLGVLAQQAIRGLLASVPATSQVGLAATITIGSSKLLAFVRVISLLGLAIGLGDYAYQRRQLMTSLKMTKQEVKDEARQSEGDPTVKGELRKRQYAIARSRVLAAVRTADVVVANPTHFSVALQYDPDGAVAPKVVAKGADELARRIREEAGTSQIPVVEDPPLARYLYATCETGSVIPPEIYLAVARLLAFVYSLPDYVRAAAPLHPVPSIVPVDPGEETALRARSAGRRARQLASV